MDQVQLRIRRPSSPADALSSDLSTEVAVGVGAGGHVSFGNAAHSKLYDDDPVFLHAILDALRLEVLRLEQELGRTKKQK